MQGAETVFSLIILVFSVISHEVAHGYAAYWFGDKTAYFAGRLTLNPLRHIDPLGTVIFPLLSYLSFGFLAGWAKPVPYNPFLLKNRYWGEIVVSSAGILTNVVIGIIFAVFLRNSDFFSFSSASQTILFDIVIINIFLAAFNVLPFPPFDGLRIIFAIFPRATAGLSRYMDENHLAFIVLSIFIASYVFKYLLPAIYWFVSLLTGVSFN